MRKTAALLTALLAQSTPGAAHSADAPLPRQRQLTERTFASTPERLEAGRYLVEHVLQCFICHSERDPTEPGAPPLTGRKGAGAVVADEEDHLLVAPNITPDVETGAGAWTDDMLARAIREGIGHDGRALHPAMWYASFAQLSDEDLAAVVVYLRSIPAVRNPLPHSRLSAETRSRIASLPRPITGPVPGPAPGDVLARGRYLLNVADCAGCHTSWHSPRNPGLFGGGNLIERRQGSAFSSNITRDDSGAGYPAAAFATVMRTGKAGSLSHLMPWVAFRGMTDADLEAIHAALGVLEPVRHYVGNQGAPQHCAVCGQSHPLGEYNRLELPAAVPLDAGQLERLAGRYRHAAWELTVTIRAEGTHLYGREADGPEIELIGRSPLAFLAPGWPSPVEFVLDETGRAVRMLALDLQPEPFERLP